MNGLWSEKFQLISLHRRIFSASLWSTIFYIQICCSRLSLIPLRLVRTGAEDGKRNESLNGDGRPPSDGMRTQYCFANIAFDHSCRKYMQRYFRNRRKLTYRLRRPLTLAG